MHCSPSNLFRDRSIVLSACRKPNCGGIQPAGGSETNDGNEICSYMLFKRCRHAINVCLLYMTEVFSTLLVANAFLLYAQLTT